jgi:plastocyanin
MQRRTFLAAATTGVVAALAGCGEATGLADDEYDIGMSTNRFLPEVYTVSVGDEVVWGNTSSRVHTATAYDDNIPEGATYFASGGFENTQAALDGWPQEGGIQPGETYAHTFETAGEHHYFCIPHEAARMVGTVVVE